MKKPDKISDTFVTIEYNGVVVKSTNSIKQSTEPKWDCICELSVEDWNDNLLLTVWEGSQEKKKKSLGEVKVKLSEYKENNFNYAEQSKFYLMKHDGNEKVGGKIILKIGKVTAAKKENLAYDDMVEQSVDLIDQDHEKVKKMEHDLENIRSNTMVGIQENLEKQKHVLDKTTSDLDDSEAYMEKNKEHMRVIESPLGWISNIFHPPKDKRVAEDKVEQSATKIDKEHEKKIK